MWVCEAGKLMSHCTVGVCECLVFHFSVALHIKNHESPSRPPCQTTPRQLYWCARVCNHSFLFMRSLLCVTLPFFYNLDLFVIHMPNVFMLCLCVMCGCLWRFWLDFFNLIFVLQWETFWATYYKFYKINTTFEVWILKVVFTGCLADYNF